MIPGHDAADAGLAGVTESPGHDADAGLAGVTESDAGRLARARTPELRLPTPAVFRARPIHVYKKSHGSEAGSAGLAP
jgi:hypothetical protein